MTARTPRRPQPAFPLSHHAPPLTLPACTAAHSPSMHHFSLPHHAPLPTLPSCTAAHSPSMHRFSLSHHAPLPTLPSCTAPHSPSMLCSLQLLTNQCVTNPAIQCPVSSDDGAPRCPGCRRSASPVDQDFLKVQNLLVELQLRPLSGALDLEEDRLRVLLHTADEAVLVEALRLRVRPHVQLLQAQATAADGQRPCHKHQRLLNGCLTNLSISSQPVNQQSTYQSAANLSISTQPVNHQPNYQSAANLSSIISHPGFDRYGPSCQSSDYQSIITESYLCLSRLEDH